MPAQPGFSLELAECGGSDTGLRRSSCSQLLPRRCPPDRPPEPIHVTMLGDSVADSLQYMPSAEQAAPAGLRRPLRPPRLPAARLVRLPVPGHRPVLRARRDPRRRQLARGRAGRRRRLQRRSRALPRRHGPGDPYGRRPRREARGVGDACARRGRPSAQRTPSSSARRRSSRRSRSPTGTPGAPASRGSAPDGLHLTGAGATALARFLRPYLAQAAAEIRAASFDVVALFRQLVRS